MLLHVASAKLFAPPEHSLSRPADHIEVHAMPFEPAKDASAEASETVKISSEVSLTPIIGVTATLAHAALSDSPQTLLTCDWVEDAACSAKAAILPLGLGAA